MVLLLVSAILLSSSILPMSSTEASYIEKSYANENEISTNSGQTKCSMSSVSDLKVFSTRTNTITLRWSLTWNKSNVSYVVQWEITEGSGRCTTPVCAPLGEVTTYRKYFALDGMSPFTRVCLSVFPRTRVDERNCDGPPSHLCARTLPQDLTIRITALNSTAISIAWKKQAGATGYSVRYCTRSGTCPQLDFDAKNATCREKQLPADITELAVKKLKPWTSFLFKIVPYNTSGIDCFTTRVGRATPPREIKAKKISQSTVLVSWQPPAEPNGPISRYHVRVEEEGYVPRTIRDEDVGSTFFQIENIMRRMTYIVQVQAVNYDYGYRIDVWGEPAAVRLRFRN